MAKKSKKVIVCRFYNKKTGEHYTVRLGRNAYEALSGKKIKKYSKKLNKHVEFELTKKVK
jgi:ribosomal protein L33